jgi:hypothetical protein
MAGTYGGRVMKEKNRFELNRGGGGFSKKGVAFYLALILMTITLGGCVIVSDDHEDPPPIFTTRITSDVEADGDIALSPPATYTISSALDTGNVLAGIDPGSSEEFRGFLGFPLRGSHGVPLDADIKSATLDVFISGVSVSPSDRVLPFIIDLVAFQPPWLIADDFDRVVQPPLLTLPFDFYPSDAGATVVIDVTALMDEAQAQGLSYFQLRFLLDFSAASGLIEIHDRDLETAPLLTVSYF